MAEPDGRARSCRPRRLPRRRARRLQNGVVESSPKSGFGESPLLFFWGPLLALHDECAARTDPKWVRGDPKPGRTRSVPKWLWFGVGPDRFGTAAEAASEVIRSGPGTPVHVHAHRTYTRTRATYAPHHHAITCAAANLAATCAALLPATSNRHCPAAATPHCRRARSHCASMTQREQRASRSERVGLVAAAGDRCRCLRALLVAQLPSAARGARPALALVAPHSQALMMPQSMTRPSVINLSSETRSADVPHVIEGRTQL